ncbi:uncharacterized protein PY17X_0844301 [Plasmodium yoelii]|uniref:PIR protein n=3 Tax=Plasmodium yoelii TaxID=5861 RepID=A0AAE9WR89_PLAYO|nr:uncharacterized protein PY17X_0844301 [Plasmodium yoelii]WBY57009.1 PIR protein [Plasmodium yoelii yoelii]CDS44149.1 YIR protein [Plasmodium yoelii]VTZ77884.1 PIR protein [Plasmodium yoelii]|eukprot:XP_727236.2 uncharacterized protein PY17X_0844301 [Plasmodium yoelii]
MNKEVCEKFQEVRNSIPDEPKDKGIPEFDDSHFLNNYCDSSQCQSYFDRISAGCLYLLDQFYNDSCMFPSPKNSNPYIVEYILIWLSYILNLDKSKDHNNINDFYNYQINSCDQYKTQIIDLPGYENYKGLIDARKNLLYMGSSNVSKFYEAFKSLCNLYTQFDEYKQNCKNYLEDNEFLKKYENLKNGSDMTKDDSYSQIMSTLLKDYDGLKRECEVALSPPPKETKQNPGLTHGQTPADSSEEILLHGSEEISGQNYEQTVQNLDVTSSSSSIVSKLIPVLLIFGAIPIFLGISYKYSLFGFRKRVQKQHLREKLKK